MVIVKIERGPWGDSNNTIIINASSIEIIKEDGVFKLYAMDVAGQEHRVDSTDESLENVYINDSNVYRKRRRI